MLLREVRHDGKHQKLLFKVLIQEDALIISTKCRDSEEPVLTNLETILEPYVDSRAMEHIREAFKSIYVQKTKEE